MKINLIILYIGGVMLLISLVGMAASISVGFLASEISSTVAET